MSVIEVKNVLKSFKSKSENVQVLKGLSMKVKQGQIYSLMGSSGCGKTTLISCIVGLLKLDSGKINIFNDTSDHFPSSRIGFMPQEIALVENFKIKEMIWFFGRIYGLNTKELIEKLSFVTDLLELPDSDQFIKNCSGGQQRRISFAVTLIHDPDLLILDEPTVGVDPLLRERIWNFLIELTQTKNTTILLSTHYIEEAKQSHQIGLMRNGVLIIEDSPQNIMQINETTDMEEAFLKLSQKQEMNIKTELKMSQIIQDQDTSEVSDSALDSNNSKIKKRKPKIMKALLSKHYTEFIRNPVMCGTAILLPTLMCIGIYFGFGDCLKGLVLGVVNNEVPDYFDCLNSSLKTFDVRDSECILEKTSCRFLNSFDPDAAELKFYKSYEEAYKDARKTSIIGFIQFSKKYTESLWLFNDEIYDEDSSQQGTIQVYLDHTNMQQLMFIKKELYETYERFMQQIMVDCGKLEGAGKIPINFEAAHGEISFNLKATVAHAVVLAFTFFVSATTMATTILDEKSTGLWNRVIVAGVRPNYFLISHLIEGFSVNCIVTIGLSIFDILLMAEVRTLNSIILTTLLLFLTGMFGVLFGIFTSVFCKTVASSMYFNKCVLYTAAYFGGILWPIEGLPKIARFYGYLIPISLPTIALRNIAVKDSTLGSRDVQFALGSLIIWIIVITSLTIFLNKRK